jgi:hypothetical protein
MKKYIVEGGIDFFAELYKSLDDEENNHKTDEDNNICLITNKPLTDKFVEMNCGHKFNYLPLYNDLLNHKKKFNNMEGSATRLKENEVRCPYCRKKSTGLLPYYEELNLPKVGGVNYIDVNYNADTDTIPTNSYYKKCEYLTPNIHFNFNSQNVVEVYKQNLNLEDCKYIKCNYMGTQIDYEHLSDNFGDDKHYCWNHKKMIIRNYKNKKAEKIKEEKKNLKLKEKEDKQKEKDEAKKKAKEEKEKVKEELKKSVKLAKMNKKPKTVSNDITNDNIIVIDLTNENIVIDTLTAEGDTNNNGQVLLCQEILKTGKNKGTQCGSKVFENNLCKRHSNKQLTTNI